MHLDQMILDYEHYFTLTTPSGRVLVLKRRPFRDIDLPKYVMQLFDKNNVLSRQVAGDDPDFDTTLTPSKSDAVSSV